jgi:hypothetical protein
MTHSAPADYRGGVVLDEVAGLESVIGRMIEPLMADHPKCRPLTIALSDCRVVPSYCEGFCPAESDGRAMYRQRERLESPRRLHRRGARDENR